jgi:phosphatidylglycerophosphatase A
MRSIADRFALVVGTGMGSGLLRPAPGTWGSVVGFAYVQLLLGLPLAIAVMAVAGIIVLSVWASGRCAEIFEKKDPGKVVIDEIAAVPLAVWPMALLPERPWWLWATVFVAWRVADIVKPPPARQLEALPGGWGIVADDLMSAAYVGAVFGLAVWLGWLP